MSDSFPKFKAAVVQASSILYDREKCVEKAVALIEEAARGGADLVALPESFIPGYPFHLWLGSPMWYHPLFKEWFCNSVEIPSKTVERLREVARKRHINVVIGVTEREHNSCYNTLLYISRRGELLGKHRKVMPTHVERAHWGLGDGSDLVTVDMDFGKLSGLLCMEHSMDLARHALIAQQAKVHVAAWVGFSNVQGWESFNESTSLCARYHAHAGDCFVLNVQSTADKQNVEKLCESDYQKDLFKAGGGWSAIISPGGSVLAGPLVDEEGILYADVDLSAIADWAHWHDATGHYARPDALSLMVNSKRNRVCRPMHESGAAAQFGPAEQRGATARLVEGVEQLLEAVRQRRPEREIERMAAEVTTRSRAVDGHRT
ncbi:carbon-nitrogen hydrolase family protein [Sorangium sp. So ce233]|uniref:carbon-nitrogen hydrolase family protein n=1 Tax=Sorangium sp. So ce233 TaxID=3133290 RepID=UPI003F5DE193